MKLKTKNKELGLPLFLPVYQPKSNLISLNELKNDFLIEGLILNSFFLYKDRETREKFKENLSIHNFIDFHGLIMTDSGAFQGLKRPLLLSNKKIVDFQKKIGSDIISPLDLISPPWEKYQIAKKKMCSTIKRIKEAKEIAGENILAGVQQGGRFLDLRDECLEEILKMGVKYVAIGSLVPFFNKNHDLYLIKKIIQKSRQMIGSDIPMHVFGAGDPLELPFLVLLGANIFDSSSYGHYAIGGWYMTSYGALSENQKDKIKDFNCDCPICRNNEINLIFSNKNLLAKHNLFCIFSTIEKIQKSIQSNKLNKLLSDVLEIHNQWFPNSKLKQSWLEK